VRGCGQKGTFNNQHGGGLELDPLGRRGKTNRKTNVTMGGVYRENREQMTRALKRKVLKDQKHRKK